MLHQMTVDLDYCSLLEGDGIITLDEISLLIPGYIHLNNVKTGAMEYVSKKALDIFETTMEDIKRQGKAFVNKISDKKSQHVFELKNRFFMNLENQNRVYSYIQRLQYKTKRIPYTLFYSTAKLYKDKSFCISFTQPLKMLQHNSFLKEIVEDRYVFFNKNYARYRLLTKRECEILKRIAAGDSNRRIADRLFISYNTVRTHRKNICAKLETGRLIDLVKYSNVFLHENTP